ncbi:DUF6428 family protein [Psychroserpens sp. SPM9]|uniref:DUF6428 family protein n=1 Tax=Psychroserpens sp. SPM9 TaxID=2975598 RepID=UPI0021A72D08|nr:DUF6428 family protein [Psychroserpens sp. SPM9]MDG5490852.1 DUF6428 family protein [Psychroserpens sp. SPM9]
MKTQELFSILEQHQEKSLLFEYAPNAFVGANYHITEVKHLKIDAVDCGAQTDSWNETIIQLWESPLEISKTTYMSVLKALGILKKVGQMKAYDLNAEVKFEYSNSSFHTAQLFVNDFKIENQNLIFQLGVQKTDCKAKELCGLPETVTQTLDKAKEKVESCCSPQSGCC